MAAATDDIILPEDALPSLRELPGDLRQVAETILPVLMSEQAAVRAVILLVDKFRGTYIYCRGLAEWKISYRNGCIRKEYDQGRRVPEIARRWRLSERWVWDILGRLEDKRGKVWDEGA